MFVDSCLYPFAITLAALLWLFVNHVLFDNKVTAKLTHNLTSNTLRLLTRQNEILVNVVLFIPALWIYASFLSTKGAGDSGLIWLVASVSDSYFFYKNPNRKRLGYIISLLALLGLWCGGVYGLFLNYQIHM